MVRRVARWPIAPGPEPRHIGGMPADSFAAFYARYVEHCQRAGVAPVTPERAAAILAQLAPLALTRAQIIKPTKRRATPQALN